MEVVADSNVFVSALVYGGKPLQLLELGLDREIHLVTSLSIVEETLAVLERKFLAQRGAASRSVGAYRRGMLWRVQAGSQTPDRC